MRGYWDAGVRHIVALRGDMPDPDAPYAPACRRLCLDARTGRAASRAIAPFEISVSAYPERHPDSPTFEHDIELLKKKVDAGATRALTQFGFYTDAIARFRDEAARAGINIPIVPGLIPTTNIKGIARMATRSGASVPDWLMRLYEGLDKDPGNAAADRRHRPGRTGRGAERRGLRPIPFLHTQPGRSHLCRLPHSGAARDGDEDAEKEFVMSFDRAARIAWLKEEAKKRIILLDGSWGVMIQGYKLEEKDFRGDTFCRSQP